MAGALVRPFAAVRQSYVVELEPLMRRIAATLVLAIAVACGGSDATSPPNQAQGTAFTGTYTLRRVVVPGASAAQRRWHLYAASIRQVR